MQNSLPNDLMEFLNSAVATEIDSADVLDVEDEKIKEMKLKIGEQKAQRIELERLEKKRQFEIVTLRASNKGQINIGCIIS